MSSEQIITKPTPSVVLAVRDLQRLESAELHMERVMDIRNKESHLFGFKPERIVSECTKSLIIVQHHQPQDVDKPS